MDTHVAFCYITQSIMQFLWASGPIKTVFCLIDSSLPPSDKKEQLQV